jgi:hypothetical protein
MTKCGVVSREAWDRELREFPREDPRHEGPPYPFSTVAQSWLDGVLSKIEINPDVAPPVFIYDSISPQKTESGGPPTPQSAVEAARAEVPAGVGLRHAVYRRWWITQALKRHRQGRDYNQRSERELPPGHREVFGRADKMAESRPAVASEPVVVTSRVMGLVVYHSAAEPAGPQ